MADAKTLRLGPSGRSGGTPKEILIDPGMVIKQLVVHYGSRVDAIEIRAYGPYGGDTIVDNPLKMGGDGGKKLGFVDIPMEGGAENHLTTVEGKFGANIDSLWFKTNTGGNIIRIPPEGQVYG